MYCLDRQVSSVEIFEGSKLVWCFLQVIRSAYGADAKVICRSRQTASGDEPVPAERMCWVSVVERRGRGLIVVDEENMLSTRVGAWSLHGASWTWSARCCDFFAV